jgi:hypothetical protein
MVVHELLLSLMRRGRLHGKVAQCSPAHGPARRLPSSVRVKPAQHAAPTCSLDAQKFRDKQPEDLRCPFLPLAGTLHPRRAGPWSVNALATVTMTKEAPDKLRAAAHPHWQATARRRPPRQSASRRARPVQSAAASPATTRPAGSPAAATTLVATTEAPTAAPTTA